MRATYSWRPGMYFRLQTPKRGIADMICLLGEKKSGTLKSGPIAIRCSEDVYSQPDTVYMGITPPPSTPDTVPASSSAGPAPKPSGCAEM